MRAAFRHRRAPLIAIIAAVAFGAALVSACAGLLETALRLDTPAHRLAGADLVVAAPEHATLAAGAGRPAQSVTLSERPPIAPAVQRAVARVPGVARVSRVPGALAVDLRDGASAERVTAAISGAVHAGNLTVLAGADRGRAEAAGVAGNRLTLILLAGIFGGMTLVVMALLLSSIVSLSIEQRASELGLLRTIGATPRQIRRMVVRRTMVPATLAATGGAFAGPLLAAALFGRLQDGGVVAGVVALRTGVLSVAAGGVAAWLSARISVAVAAHRASRLRMADAVDEGVSAARIGRVRGVLACVAVTGGASCAVMTPFAPATNAAAIGGGIALAGSIACALLAPVLAERFADRFGPAAARLWGVPGALAVTNLRARAARTGALLTPVVLVVALGLSNLYQQTTQADAMRADYADGLRADAVISSDRPLPAAAISAAGSAGTVSPLVDSSGWIEHPVDPAHRIDPLRLIGADGSAVASPVAAGSLSGLRGNAVAVPEGLAHKLHIAVGDRIGLVLGDGAHVTTTVAAVLDAPGRYPALVLPPALLADHTGGGIHTLLVNGGGDTRARVAAAVRSVPGVTVSDRSAVGRGIDTGLRVDRWITFAVVGVIVAYAAMSLVNLLVAALGGRRRELALLRMAGATRRQIAQMLRAEAILVAAMGIVTGIAVALAGLVPLAIATAGSPIPTGPPVILLALVVLAFGLVLTPTTAAGRVLTRRGRAA